ncbi:porphobilinogen synthase [Gammaproteobacteria bacterium]|nr:porphobilinogen synthase [Gammaproteobacteria bacterium]
MTFSAAYPSTRLRRLRQNQTIRSLVRENTLCMSDFISPIFISQNGHTKLVESDQILLERYSIEGAEQIIQRSIKMGIKSFALFPVIPRDLKSENGKEALNENQYFIQAIVHFKKTFTHITLICDVALDPYTTHGHDGVLDAHGRVDNDKTIKILAEQACLLSLSGCDVVAPSDMQDGRIGLIRSELDFYKQTQTMIMSYAVKYASCLYQPFRNVVSTSKNSIDKSHYQQDFHNSDEALHEAKLDLNEGADILLIKPAMTYLDIIYRIRNTFRKPTFAFQVSGEYLAFKAYEKTLNPEMKKDLWYELFVCFKRAGANAIISYATYDFAIEYHESP